MKEPASNELIAILKKRFGENMHRHKDCTWGDVEAKLWAKPEKLRSIEMMEQTGGEPDVVDYDDQTEEYIFCDCSTETPSGRRSVCYDRAALESRKEHRPASSARDMATEMGVELLSQEQYRKLQSLGKFDTKTSSWIETPAETQKLGGALFAEYRYGQVFVYHNGAQSYYAVRGFRASLRL